MATFGSVNPSLAVVVPAFIVLSLQTAEVSGTLGYYTKKTTTPPPPPPPPVECVNEYLETCLTNKATCQAYAWYKRGYDCPGHNPSPYRRALSTDPYDESGYAPPPTLDLFVCPCKETLMKYFDIVKDANSCEVPPEPEPPAPKGYGDAYRYGGGGGDSSGGDSGSTADFLCDQCPGSMCGAPDAHSGGYYRHLDGEGYGHSYGSPSGGYGNTYKAPTTKPPPPPKEECTCESIEDAAIEKFCIDFVGSGSAAPGYHRNRKLDGRAVEGYYAPPVDPCSPCVYDCIEYVKDCCPESVCPYEVPKDPAPPAYEAPAYDPPAYEPPAYEPAAYEPPAYEPPAYEPAAYEPPAYEPPAYEAPSGYDAPSAYKAPSGYDAPSGYGNP